MLSKRNASLNLKKVIVITGTSRGIGAGTAPFAAARVRTARPGIPAAQDPHLHAPSNLE
jgi:NAD(P)-dependent dehydrogenase (short-subunit alcohol dehydrogenase family)